jgi:ribosomal protein S18 acetylase RimI-like enzyme
MVVYLKTQSVSSPHPTLQIDSLIEENKEIIKVENKINMKNIINNEESKDYLYRYREATIDDAIEINEFAKIVFRETFFIPCGYNEEDLEAYYEESYKPVIWCDYINDPSKYLLLAERYIDNASNSNSSSNSCKIVGYTLVGGPTDLPHDELTEENRLKTGELSKLYVDSSIFGQGISKKLALLSLKWLLSKVSGDIYLGVWSENWRARSFYHKFGFFKVYEHAYPVGDKEDLDYIYKCSRSVLIDILKLEDNDEDIDMKIGNCESVINKEVNEDVNIDVVMKYIPIGGKSHHDTVPFDSSQFLWPLLMQLQHSLVETHEDEASLWNKLHVDEIILMAGDNIMNGIQCKYSLNDINYSNSLVDNDINISNSYNFSSYLHTSFHDSPHSSNLAVPNGDEVREIVVKYGDLGI